MGGLVLAPLPLSLLFILYILDLFVLVHILDMAVEISFFSYFLCDLKITLGALLV